MGHLDPMEVYRPEYIRVPIAIILVFAVTTSLGLFAAPPEYPPQIVIEGTLAAFSWANTDNRLALVTTKETGGEICIIETEPLTCIIQIEVPDYLYVQDVEWTADDSGLMILTDKSAECPEGVACFDYKSLSFLPDYQFDYIRFSSADQRWSVEYDPESRSWATDTSGEGHPDIEVSRDGETIISTDAYPGTVYLIGWRTGKLYLASSLDLQTELNQNGVLIITPINPEMDNTDSASIIYSLDIENALLTEEDSVFIPDITQTSKNGLQYYFQFNILKDENRTEILMW